MCPVRRDDRRPRLAGGDRDPGLRRGVLGLEGGEDQIARLTAVESCLILGRILNSISTLLMDLSITMEGMTGLKTEVLEGLKNYQDGVIVIVIMSIFMNAAIIF